MTPHERICRKCGIPLIIGENVTQGMINNRHYICRACTREYNREYQREWNHRTGRSRSMSENKECPQFLGIYVAERILSHVFKHVEKMPYGNPGYDFICGGGYMIDVKASCRRINKKCADTWTFTIGKNKTAEHFLCIAFDNRQDLNPEYMWLIPAEKINDLWRLRVSEPHVSKWDEYKLDISKVISCCNTLR